MSQFFYLDIIGEEYWEYSTAKLIFLIYTCKIGKTLSPWEPGRDIDIYRNKSGIRINKQTQIPI
jgi:hypothetical protein